MYKNNIQVEICCGSYYDALQAWKGGANRIELNSALYLGGLTPSVGMLRKVKEETSLKVICMVRPRGAGFCYGNEDFAVMAEDAEILLENGADGLAFGCLDNTSGIHIEQTERILKIIKKHKKESVFHRAFDCVKNVDESMNILISLGIDRILTSGLKNKAPEGAEIIKYLQDRYGKQIEILTGSGINEENVEELIHKTGVRQIHSSCKGWKIDTTTSGEDVSFAYRSFPVIKDMGSYIEKTTEEYEIVEAEKVRALIERVRNL